jgi:hypothetical protein
VNTASLFTSSSFDVVGDAVRSDADSLRPAVD